jgi:oligoendopeptidase F
LLFLDPSKRTTGKGTSSTERIREGESTMMETEAKTAADWDMTPYFSGVGAGDYRQFCSTLSTDLGLLTRQVGELPPLEPGHASAWAGFLALLEDASARLQHLDSYLSCLGAADARDTAVQAETGRLAVRNAELDKLLAPVRTHLARASADAFEALLAEPRLATAAYWLHRQREYGRNSMDPPLEVLTADLEVTGLSAWSRLYDQLTGKLVFELKVPGQPARQVPISRTRSLLEEADPAVRKAALDGANEAWATIADTLAACLNAISGSRLTLARHRKQHFLESALFDAGIQRRTLEAMMEVVTAAQPLVRGYLRHKARLLGRERLGFQDLTAPVTSSAAVHLGWDEGVRLVVDAFGTFHPDLADYARHAVAERWIDYRPRLGKRPGGFCSSSPLLGQSRVFMTYDGTSADVLTLAHELGHGFHNWVMRDLRPWARAYPMTLAETASIFCEQVVMAALLERVADKDEQLKLLDTRLQDASAFLLNIPMRFWFEHAFYDARAEGEQSVSQLQDLLLEAQRRAYGDALAQDELDAWFWASKLHFYISEVSFYNFPYTFGYLFSLGIFARARKEGRAFLQRYRELLRQTGSAPAEEVAWRHLGVDLGSTGFWSECIDLIAVDCEAFEALAG